MVMGGKRLGFGVRRTAVQSIASLDIVSWVSQGTINPTYKQYANELMKGYIMRVLHRLIYLSLILIVTQASAQVVDLPDPNLRQVIRETLNLPGNAPTTQQKMLKLERLDAGGNRDITDLTGLEYAINLKGLGLYHNPITDISPLSHLTQLEGFNLWGCRIVDLSPLRNLKNLRSIILGNNQISDLSPLSELTSLTFLELESNQISDLSPLAGLINLTVLQLDGNQIADFSPLASLVNLEELWINGNFGDSQRGCLREELRCLSWCFCILSTAKR